ncbi:hypothetical protein AGLY_015526 [Aphis glycines]|uniref:Uncharacterized protein n=1 Tax=Aphis glycines TaxID=307491 RepID=A0A6G0T118_APHGL|nr:hypothetical protein AGLY_015526 [Aphis glycines]
MLPSIPPASRLIAFDFDFKIITTVNILLPDENNASSLGRRCFSLIFDKISFVDCLRAPDPINKQIIPILRGLLSGTITENYSERSHLITKKFYFSINFQILFPFDSIFFRLHLSLSCSSTSKSLKKLSNVSEGGSTSTPSFVMFVSILFWNSESMVELGVGTSFVEFNSVCNDEDNVAFSLITVSDSLT